MITLGPKDHLVLGAHNAICDVCGFKFKASELRRRWDNYMVCPSDYEQRHPQDLIRLKPERQAVPWARPEPTDTFRTPAPIDPNSLSPAIALPSTSAASATMMAVSAQVGIGLPSASSAQTASTDTLAVSAQVGIGLPSASSAQTASTDTLAVSAQVGIGLPSASSAQTASTDTLAVSAQPVIALPTAIATRTASATMMAISAQAGIGLPDASAVNNSSSTNYDTGTSGWTAGAFDDYGLWVITDGAPLPATAEGEPGIGGGLTYSKTGVNVVAGNITLNASTGGGTVRVNINGTLVGSYVPADGTDRIINSSVNASGATVTVVVDSGYNDMSVTLNSISIPVAA